MARHASENVAVILPPGAINTGDPVEPRPSATVLLIRGSRPFELLLVRRPGGADFAPGAYVFPGGTVHADDRGADDEIKAAAIRELFEEAGILLARRGRSLARASDCDAVRARVERRETFAGALSGRGLEPAFDRLVLMARWVTPSVLSRRYDARFYLARMPSSQKIVPQEGEVTGWLWATDPLPLPANPGGTVFHSQWTESGTCSPYPPPGYTVQGTPFGGYWMHRVEELYAKFKRPFWSQ